MLKNDMRKVIIEGGTYEDFIDKYGERYRDEFSEDIMKRCWDNTHKLIDPVEWAKYLKRNAANYVKYLCLIEEGMKDAGIRLSETKAGYMLKDLIRRQIYNT